MRLKGRWHPMCSEAWDFNLDRAVRYKVQYDRCREPPSLMQQQELEPTVGRLQTMWYYDPLIHARLNYEIQY
jgi:hypothetical protein